MITYFDILSHSVTLCVLRMIVRICMSKVRPTLLLARRSFSVKVKSGPVVTPVVVPPPKIEPENDSPNDDGDESAGDDAKGQFYQDCWHFAKTLLPAGIVLFGLKYILCVPIIGRSMSPQFNPGVADYGDTVIFLPRLRRSVPLVRGEIYLFNDPTDRLEQHLAWSSIKRRSPFKI